MRICHVGHGRLPIPPTEYGAVEDIIWNYKYWCEKFGHEFLVVNNLSPAESMLEAERFAPDAVHLHDESKLDAFSVLAAPVKILTTHDPTFFEKRNPFMARITRGDFMLGCLSDAQRVGFMLDCDVPESRLLMTPNGARSDLIHFSAEPANQARMICLGMIGKRKRQNALLNIPFVDCIGPVAAYEPIVTGGITFDSWTKGQVCRNLTDYAALVLLSKSEADPLVVKEALMAGLDVVVSEAASANLDRSQPFVHVLSEGAINNPTLLRIALENILKAPKNRAAVRKYAEAHFNWSVLAVRYIDTLGRLFPAAAVVPQE